MVLAILMGLVVVGGPVTVDMFVPSIPKIAAGLDTTVGLVTVSLFSLLSGNAVGFLISGPISDRYGRKPVVLGMLAVFTLTALGAGFSQNVEMLILWRFCQGVAQSGARVVAVAIARDLFDRERLAKFLADVMFVTAIGIVITPITGGQIAQHLSWPWVFWAMAAFGAFVFLAFSFFFHESLVRRNPNAVNPTVLVPVFFQIARHPAYLKFVLCGGFALAGFVAFISISPIVLIESFGVAPRDYGFLFAVVSVAYLCGTFASGRLVLRLGMDRMMAIGTSFLLVGSFAAAALAIAGVNTPAAVIGPMAVYAIAMAFLLPQANASSMQPFTTTAGAASSLMGFIQSMMGAVVVAGLSAACHDTATSMAVTLLMAALISAAIYFFGIRTNRNRAIASPPIS